MTNTTPPDAAVPIRRQRRSSMPQLLKERSFWFGMVMIAGAVLVTVYKIDAAGRAPISARELALFDGLSAILGLAGSFAVGRESAKETISRNVGPLGRSAFRRGIGIYQTLRLCQVDVAGDDAAELKLSRVALALSILVKQAADAMEDWRDVVPSAVEGIAAEAEARRKELE